MPVKQKDKWIEAKKAPLDGDYVNVKGNKVELVKKTNGSVIALVSSSKSGEKPVSKLLDGSYKLRAV